MTISLASKGRKFPCLMAVMYGLASSIRQGKKNFSVISWNHCFRRFEGVMMSIRRFRSAHFWDKTSPASIVFPSPTSSASSAPLATG